jgi:cell division protease FtsH
LSELFAHVDQGAVTAMVLVGDTVEFSLVGGQTFRTVLPPNYVVGNPAFISDLVRKHVRIDVRHVSEPASIRYGSVVLGVGLLTVLGVMLFRVSGGHLLTLEQKVKEADERTSAVTFADLAGMDEAKQEVKEIVDVLREPQRFAAVGGRIPKGILLIGPPGTGKTLLARSMAGEAHVPFLFASGSEFVEIYAGVGAKRIRKLFREARRHPACIVFIDELDAVGRSRGNSPSMSHEEREQTLNQLLVEMDGFSPNRCIVVIGATNRPDILDTALLRPGRFDRHVTVGAPDLRGREQILGIHTRRISLDADVNLRQVARGTPGFSGAEIANLVNEAVLTAVRQGRRILKSIDFDQARDKMLMGAERKSLMMTDHERTTCAYHEAGHAIVAASLRHADPLHKVTIVPRGRALGVTMQLPEDDRHTHSREFLDAQLAILMGGRVAEELFLHQLTSGASNDIERATQIARRMVCEFGMSPTLGPLAYHLPSVGTEKDAGPRLSEATAQLVDREIRELVLKGYETARGILTRNRPAVSAMVESLLAVESLDADAIKQVIASATAAGARDPLPA